MIAAELPAIVASDDAALYRCSCCRTVRQYGEGEPESTRQPVLIQCEGLCERATRHWFVEVRR